MRTTSFIKCALLCVVVVLFYLLLSAVNPSGVHPFKKPINLEDPDSVDYSNAANLQVSDVEGDLNHGDDVPRDHINELKTNETSKKKFISDISSPWKIWHTLTAPGSYRSCVRLPSNGTSGVHIAWQNKNTQMTVTMCIEQCNKMKFTYTGLTHGTECYCLTLLGETSFLNYINNALCNISCSGEKIYNCGGNGFLSLYRTAVPDKRCSIVGFEKEKSLPLIALASFPRSGNTWSRNLLQKATGIYTGNHEFKTESKLKELIENVFAGGAVDYKLRKTIPVKTHSFTLPIINEFTDGAILLIRNPYRAIVAEIFRQKNFSEHKYPVKEAMDYFKSKAWIKFVNSLIEQWKTMALRWTLNSSRLLVVHYENMLIDTKNILRKMVSFLKLPINEKRITCAVQEVPSSSETGISLGNFGIHARHYLTVDPFTPSMHKKLDSYIAEVNRTLTKYGHKPLPTYGSTTIF